MKKITLFCSFLLIFSMIFMINPALAAKNSSSKATSQSSSQLTQKVNINTANVASLAQLPGVGEKTAQNIIKHRKKNGKFKKLEDLLNVKGIGEKKFKKLKAYITL